MAQSKKIKLNGIEYLSIVAAAKALGVNPITSQVRLNKGWSTEEAFSLKERPAQSKRKIMASGMEFPSLPAAARHFGLSPLKVKTRVLRGWTLQEALELEVRSPPKPAHRTRISITASNGERTFDSIKEAALAFGLEPGTVRARLSGHDWSPEMALGLIPPPSRTAPNRTPVDLTIDGTRYRYDSVSQAAEARGLNEFLVFNRRNRLGWSMAESLELLPREKGKNPFPAIIYLITHRESGKQYVGQTLCTIEERWEQHVAYAAKEGNVRKVSLHSAIRNYSKHSFEVKQIDTAYSLDELNRLERHWIAKLNTRDPHGFNKTRGGQGFGASVGRKITVEGAAYPSISAAARHYQLQPRIVLKRLRNGWSMLQALELRKTPSSQVFAGRSIEIRDGEHTLKFDSVSMLSAHYGISYPKVNQRLTKLDWTPEQAVELERRPHWTHPAHAFRLVVRSKDEVFRSKAEAARHYGVGRWHEVTRRLRRGWSIEQALGLEEPPINRMAEKEVRITVGDQLVVYPSQSAAAAAHRISFKKVSARRKLGWTWEEALGITSRKTTKQRQPELGGSVIENLKPSGDAASGRTST
jgi:hypothetical protein